MTSSVFSSWKNVDWEKVWAISVISLTIVVVISYCILGISEGNGMVIFGFVALVVGVLVWNESEWKKEGGRFLNYAWLTALFLFFLASPFLYVADADKVWVVGDRTTLGNSVLFRLPFTPHAVSVKKKRNVNWSFTAKTKEGVLVAGSVTAAFRLTDDDAELASSVSGIEDPNEAIDLVLKEVLRKAFSDTIASRTAADIAALPNNFMLEVDVGSAAAVRQFGLRRNGEFSVFGLRPYFIDR